MFDKITDVVLKNGLPGVIILVLGFVAWKLYSHNQELQEKRVTEAGESAKTLAANTTALNALADLIKDRRGAGL